MLAPLLANLLLIAADVVTVRALRRRELVWLPLGPVVVWLFWMAWGLYAWSSIFLLMQLFCWWAFVHLPVVLALGLRRVGLALAAGLALVGLYAFVWEPRRLEVGELAVAGPRLRIALVADVQTDHVGEHEARALAAVAAAEPDLVLFAGDYVQVDDPADYPAEAARLRELVATLRPRLGGFAVRGDVDPDEWTTIFRGTAITPLVGTRTVEVGGITLTGLDIRDARRADLDLPRADGFHVVLGHAPDFVLGTGRRDLNLAGHTHGGQVQLPGIGPLLTLSAVPRAWASGPTRLDDGSWLYVSRGVGMERRQAPRLRFLCPPEIVIVEVGEAGDAS
ncbi:MAG: metallophosphoesterase [Myxococcota bacterium]